ncbi:hypothetical protein BLA29_005155, partial [Euroglyphus maynei]
MAPKRRKRKNGGYSLYCPQFCRQGICNKGVRCSLIHDPSKRGICPGILTKNGCKKQVCYLSHEKTPDKMPDCRFFLRGRCTMDNCPFRHVKVNNDAVLCENFARGFCPQGLMCNKLHKYKCPTIRQQKTCRRGDNCNHYHPTNDKSNAKKSPKKKSPNQSKFKKIIKNPTANPATTSSSSQTSQIQCDELPMDLSSPNTKNILNQ